MVSDFDISSLPLQVKSNECGVSPLRATRFPESFVCSYWEIAAEKFQLYTHHISARIGLSLCPYHNTIYHFELFSLILSLNLDSTSCTL